MVFGVGLTTFVRRVSWEHMPRQDHVCVIKIWLFCLNRVDRSKEGSDGERSMSGNEELSLESVSEISSELE